MHEVYAYGVVAPSTLIELEGGFPAEAGYGEIARIHPSLGGEAAGGAYVLARLGVATKMSGNRLGSDLDSRRVIGLLTEAALFHTKAPVCEVSWFVRVSPLLEQ